MLVKPYVILPIFLVTAIACGLAVDAVRARQHSALSGFFENEPVDISTRTEGRVRRVAVREGDKVRRGQVLVELEAEPRKLQAVALEAKSTQARQHWLDVLHGPRTNDIRKQQAVVDEARAELDRLRHGSLPEEIGQAQARLAVADAVYRKALAGPRPEEVRQAHAAERAAWFRYAAARRGPTKQQRDEAKARLDAAVAAERLAVADADRYRVLYGRDAVTGQQNDQAQANLRQASARTREMQQAYERVSTGTPPEELSEAVESYRQARANSDYVLSGTRPEDIQAAEADRRHAQEALALVERGARREDIRAAEARLNQAAAVLATLNEGSRPEEIAEAKAAFDMAVADARAARVTADESVVIAPVDGVVDSVPIAQGDLVNAGTPLIRLDDPTDIWLRVYVPEAHLADVFVGERADVRVDGVATHASARVESIASTGEFTPANLQTPNDRGKQVFALRLRLTNADRRIKAGMYATVVRIGNWRP